MNFENLRKEMTQISRSFDELIYDSPATPPRGTCGLYTPKRLRFKTSPDRGRQDALDIMLSEESDRQITDDLLEHYDWTPIELKHASTQTE